ncbi:primosomal protein N' [Rhodobacteraceae bacterium]|nr:primosomal protein N' [Paracoccaceae bacterium]
MQAKEFFSDGETVCVLTSQPIDRLLDYRAPAGGCRLRAFVEVPLGPRKVLGVIWGASIGDFDRTKLRAVNRVLDLPPMQEELQEFLIRAADYTLTPLSAMLQLATRVQGLSDRQKTEKIYRLAAAGPVKRTAARLRVCEALKTFGGAGLSLSELAEAAVVSPSVVKGLVSAGAVLEDEIPRDRPFAQLNPGFGAKALNEDQDKAVQQLRAALSPQVYGASLLRGVTGSGKTEVYLEAVADVLRAGGQALVLLPEIALSAEFINRVEARFGARPAEWHSGITPRDRRRCWRMVAQNGAQLVVGARSALFLPFRNLSLIIVDEEHDSSYKQEDGVIYHARDMAVLRASIAGAHVILASATPSLESWVNATSGKYQRIDLLKRFGPAKMPKMQAIDMRVETLPSDRWISQSLLAQIKLRLEKKEQSLLFINRRGYAPVTLCRACGEQVGCPHCDARLVEHRFSRRLMCHQCGETQPLLDACPSCSVAGRMAAIGPGIERLADEIAALCPEVRIAVLSSDLFASARALKEKIQEIGDGAADIIVGTQLVAKGHNFPNLTLVGVIDADLGLQGSDLRAAEHTFQIMRQVAGRAGRAQRAGSAYLQTHQPEHPVIQAILKGDEEAFWNAEARMRQSALVPPFGRLVGLVISAVTQEEAFEYAQHLARNSRPLTEIGAQVFGPAPAPIARVRGRFRVRLLIKADKTRRVQPALRRWLKAKPKAGLRVNVDIDPQSFL